MNINNNIISIFPEAIIYANTLNIDSDKILDFCKKSIFKNTYSSLKEKANGCYASDNLNVLNNLSTLKNKIKEHVETYLYKVFKYKMNYKFLNSWITKVDKDGFSQPHIHANTFLSGVYYPIGNLNFKINFHKKEECFWNIEVEENNLFNTKVITMTIENNNTLLLFPSSLKHSVEKNISNMERYSIAFNINPKGYIGEMDNGVIF